MLCYSIMSLSVLVDHIYEQKYTVCCMTCFTFQANGNCLPYASFNVLFFYSAFLCCGLSYI